MKKIISLMLMVILCVSLVACGSNSGSDNKSAAGDTTMSKENSAEDTQVSETENETSEVATDAEVQEETETTVSTETEAGSSTLVVYFSATGNTKAVAESIADGLQADIYEIVPAEPYSDADLNYNDDNSRSTKEMNDPSARPEISGTIDNWSQYDKVFIGYPIWWGEAPRIMDTFVESYDFSGKIVIPFCTSASSGIGSSAGNLESLAGSGNWMDGQRFSGSEAATDVQDWAGQF